MPFATQSALLRISCYRAGSGTSSGARSQDDGNPPIGNNGLDFASSETLFQLRKQYQTAPGSGATSATTRTVTTDIRVNYGDPVTGQTGRLFFPLDVMLGRNLSKTVMASVEVGVPVIKDYPVYDFKTMLRLNGKF
jgi:hypothetical protein